MKRKWILAIIFFIGFSAAFAQFSNNEQNPHIGFNWHTRGIRFIEDEWFRNQPSSTKGWPSVEFLQLYDWFSDLEQPLGTTAIHGHDNWTQSVISLVGDDTNEIVQDLIRQFEYMFNRKAREYSGWYILPYIEYIGEWSNWFNGAFIWRDDDEVKIFLVSFVEIFKDYIPEPKAEPRKNMP